MGLFGHGFPTAALELPEHRLEVPILLLILILIPIPILSLSLFSYSYFDDGSDSSYLSYPHPYPHPHPPSVLFKQGEERELITGQDVSRFFKREAQRCGCPELPEPKITFQGLISMQFWGELYKTHLSRLLSEVMLLAMAFLTVVGPQGAAGSFSCCLMKGTGRFMPEHLAVEHLAATPETALLQLRLWQRHGRALQRGLS